MTAQHPLKSDYVTSANVIKGSLLSYETIAFFAMDVNDVRARDLTGTLVCLVPTVVSVPTTGQAFWVDASDSTTVDNGTTCIVDLAGNRFKVRPIGLSDLTAALLNSVFGTGGANPNIIPAGSVDPSYSRWSNSAWAAAAIGTLIGDVDAFVGSTSWRDSAATSGSVVTSLPSGSDWKNGGRGWQNRAVLFADGTVGVSGYAGMAAADGNLTNTGRFMKIGFSDGVARTITSFWVGGGGAFVASMFALDSNNVLWAWGRNLQGELGLGDITNRSLWTKINFFPNNSLTVAKVFTYPDGLGTYFLCTNGQLYYAGYNSTGRAGDGTTATPKSTPVRCGTLTNVTDVFPGCSNIDGEAALVGCLAGGSFYVWGYNASSQLGLGNTTQQTSPQNTGLTNVTKAAMGVASLALKSDGTLWSAGYNGDGGTCQGTFVGNTGTWTQIAALGTTVLDISNNSGRFVSPMALVTVAGVGRYLRTWGHNGSGQCGIGNTSSQNNPQSPVGAWQGSVDEIASIGPSTTTAQGNNYIRVGNRILATGANGNGSAGVGSATTPITTFSDVLGLRGNITSWYAYQQDTAGGLMILTDQCCLSFGYNGNGQVGTHELNVHNVYVAQEILVAGSVKGSNGAAFAFDAIDTLAHRSNYDGQPAGYRFAAYDDSPQAKLYVRQTATPGVWSSGVPLFPSFNFGTAITPGSISAQQNDYAPTGYATCGVIRQAASSDCTITGLQGGADGRVVMFINLGASYITLRNDDGATSTAANRFAFGADLRLAQYDAVAMRYDGTLSRWTRWTAAVSQMPSAFRNLLGANGGLDIWQRGAGASASIAVAASTTAYTADRWYITTGANQACTIAAATPLTSASQLAAKVQRNNAQTGTGQLKFGYPLDTDECYRARGAILALSFTVSTGANWSPASGTLGYDVYFGTGAAAKRGGGFTSESHPITGTLAVAAGSAAQRVTITASAALATSILQGEVQFTWTPVGTAGADDSFTIDDVQLEIVSGLNSVATAFERLPFSEQLRLCQRHFQKTFPYAVAPAQNTSRLGALAAMSAAAAATAVMWKLQPTMIAAPTVTTYNPNNTNANFRDIDGAVDLAATIDATVPSADMQLFTAAAAAAAGRRILIQAIADAGL